MSAVRGRTSPLPRADCRQILPTSDYVNDWKRRFDPDRGHTVVPAGIDPPVEIAPLTNWIERSGSPRGFFPQPSPSSPHNQPRNIAQLRLKTFGSLLAASATRWKLQKNQGRQEATPKSSRRPNNSILCWSSCNFALVAVATPELQNVLVRSCAQDEQRSR
jgi:hypothetical protein